MSSLKENIMMMKLHAAQKLASLTQLKSFGIMWQKRWNVGLICVRTTMASKSSKVKSILVITMLVIFFVMFILSLVNVVKHREVKTEEKRGQRMDLIFACAPINSLTAFEKCDGFNS